LGWWVPRRWNAISLLGPLLVFLISMTAIYGLAPLRALPQNWSLIFTAFLPALAIMILLINVSEEIGWTGLVFVRLQDRHGPLHRGAPDDCRFLLCHLLCRDKIMGDYGRERMGAELVEVATRRRPQEEPLT
jgi:hypothetical protein